MYSFAGRCKLRHKKKITRTTSQKLAAKKETTIGQQYLIRFNKSSLDLRAPTEQTVQWSKTGVQNLKLLNKKHGWEWGER